MDVREALDMFNEFKKTSVKVGSRERTIKSGWRHGITGIENADGDNVSVFFNDLKERKDFEQKEREVFKKTRLDYLKICFGSSK